MASPFAGPGRFAAATPYSGRETLNRPAEDVRYCFRMTDSRLFVCHLEHTDFERAILANQICELLRV